MKHIIWSNIDLHISDWRDGYAEYLEINNIDGDPNNDDEVYDWMADENDRYLDDERMNLNKILEGKILIIADLGLWDGRKQGYKIGTHNLNSIFDIGTYDYAEFYGEDNEVRAREIHHDGTNYYLFRVIRDGRDIDKLLEAIYNGEEISKQKLNYYTRSLYKDVANVYGWR